MVTDDIKGHENLDSGSSFLTGVTEDHEVIGTVYIYEENTQKTSDCDTTIGLYVANIDKNDNNTCRTIYKAINEG